MSDGNPDIKRNYGIDFLRIISMWYVVILHTLGQGGILHEARPLGIQYQFCWFLEILAYGAVDIFALISGYVSYSERYKGVDGTKYLMLWFQVAFYGVSVMLIGQVILPDAVTKWDCLKMLFPVTNGLYWYFTAYTALFVIKPFIDQGLRNCSELFLRKLFVILIAVFSVFDTVALRFGLWNGYSFVWILILYILGAIMKKCDIGKKLNKKHVLGGIFVLCLLSWLWKMFGVEFEVFNVKVTQLLFVSYTSPTILGISILHVLWFSKIHIRSWLRKVVSFAAPSAFAVYILNVHPFVWNYFMKDRFTFVANKNVIMIILIVLLFSFGFLAASVFIDKLRIVIFKRFCIQKLAVKIVKLTDNMFQWMEKRLN